MSYANRKQMSGNRTVAIIIVALLHAVLGYALVTGLAYNVIKKATEDLKTFDVEEEPPPPEEEPPPPPDQPEIPPPPSSPPPIVRTNTTPPPIVFQEAPIMQAPAPVVIPRAPPAPPPPPPPPPAKVQKATSSKGNLAGLIQSDDYPENARRHGEEGTVAVNLSIGTNGRVTGCNVTKSSGSRDLDNATCRILSSRARFTPAKNSDGSPKTDTYPQRITWRLQ
jgi:protein TonB